MPSARAASTTSVDPGASVVRPRTGCPGASATRSSRGQSGSPASGSTTTNDVSADAGSAPAARSWAAAQSKRPLAFRVRFAANRSPP
ncbi:hypothetical protein ACFQRB_15520 [Halobaculum litoreum]|uniref:Uncharacterized protein n=1 Tax=Halobaculum litoreum TaxID=3031998 RepID=A0ABD5XWJ8_9EURY